MKCPNCGGNAEGKFCTNCGTSLKDTVASNRAGTESASETKNSFGFDLSEYNTSIASALKLQEEYQKTGTMSPELLAGMQNSFGLTSVIEKMEAHTAQVNQEIEEMRKKNKKAHAAIASGVCPECGKKFKKNDIYCTCGASLLQENYEE